MSEATIRHATADGDAASIREAVVRTMPLAEFMFAQLSEHTADGLGVSREPMAPASSMRTILWLLYPAILLSNPVSRALSTSSREP